VAASRARDQMWVVHSLDPHHDLKADDLRRQLIEHAHDPNLFLRALEQKEIRPQSAFEREVMKRLTAAGYRVAPQWRVGAFRIDLVVEGETRRLAIECDGDRYQPLEKLPEDLDRQGVLERMGWSFARIRGSEFFRNPDRALKPVIEKLQLLEIFPVKSKANAGGKLPSSALLIDSVIRRAEELRNDWSSREATSSKRQGSPKSMEKTTIA
jgi:very-short-patch-repair endonuclease